MHHLVHGPRQQLTNMMVEACCSNSVAGPLSGHLNTDYLSSSRMAELKSPAAACSAARLHFCSHRFCGVVPGVGAAKGARSPAAASGTTASGGSSRSCALQGT
jgi:hypothetical protein